MRTIREEHEEGKLPDGEYIVRMALSELLTKTSEEIKDDEIAHILRGISAALVTANKKYLNAFSVASILVFEGVKSEIDSDPETKARFDEFVKHDNSYNEWLNNA